MLPRNIEPIDDEGDINPLLSLTMQENWSKLRWKVFHPLDNSEDKYFWKKAQETLKYGKKE